MIQVLDKVIISFCVLLGVLIVFVIINFHAYISSTDSFLLYLGTPAALIGAICVAFRIKREWRHILFVSFLSVVAATYAVEIWLWSISTYKSMPSGYDQRTQLEVVLQLRADGKEAFPVIVPRIIANTAPGGVLSKESVPLLPLGGVAGVSKVHCNESGAWRIYSTDAHGFANPPEAWYGEKADIVVVGDSFAHGACVPESTEFAALIRDRFSRTINLGAGGNGPLSELASIREYASERKPRVVLWFFYDNDLKQDLFVEVEHPILARYLDPEYIQGLATHRSVVQSKLKHFLESRIDESQRAVTPKTQKSNGSLWNFLLVDSSSYALNLVPWISLREIRKRLGLIYAGNEWRPPDVQTFRRVLELANHEIEGWGGRLVFVILPSWESVIAPNRAKEVYIEAARATSESLGLPVIDLKPSFDNHPDPRSLWPNRLPGHYNEAGHALVAKTVLNALKDAGLP